MLKKIVYDRPRPHKSQETIVNEAKKGIAFLVDRAVLNGDLAHLSEMEQRKIVAMAHDYAAAYANDCVIPQTDEAAQLNSDFIKNELDRALNVFFKADGKELNLQIEEFRK